MTRYAILIEKGPTSCGAYVPDLPGCVAAAETQGEAVILIREAIEFHSEAMRDAGLPIPEPSSTAEYVEVAAASAEVGVCGWRPSIMKRRRVASR